MYRQAMYVIGNITKTPLIPMVQSYLEYIGMTKTKASIVSDTWYLETAFGMRHSRVPVLDVETLEELTTERISTWLQGVGKEMRYTGKTLNRFREVINRLCNWSMRNRGVRFDGGHSPASYVERFKEKRSTIQYLTKEEIEKQLKVLDSDVRLQTAVATLIYAGLRRSEMLWLTPRDIDLRAGKNGVIRIMAKEVQGQYWQPKTGEERVVPVSKALATYLHGYYTVSRPWGIWVFPNRDGGQWDTDGFSRALRLRNEKAGFNWTALHFRHTFGSQLAMKGESLYKIAALMGNSPDVCRKHYAALSTECMLETVDF